MPEEWDKFMTTLREPLPSTFRITGSRRFVLRSAVDNVTDIVMCCFLLAVYLMLSKKLYSKALLCSCIMCLQIFFCMTMS